MNERPDGPMRALAQAILQEEDAVACTACIDHLEDYVTMQLDGDDYVAALPLIAAHLDGCVACSQSYALLYNVLLAERTGTLAVPAMVPPPDLSFLPTRPGLREVLQGAIQTFEQRLRLQFSQPLLDLLRPTAQPALAFRDAEGVPLFALDLPAPNVAIERLAVAIYPADGSDRVLVQVSVALPGRAWPDLAGITIHLSGPGTDQQATTDPWGEAAFDDVPRGALPDLLVEVG